MNERDSFSRYGKSFQEGLVQIIYEDRPFAHPLPGGEFPDVAHLVGSNRVDFSVVADHRTGRYVVTSAEDNLIKGAGGQAVQAMNLCAGFDETAGLV